MRPRSASDVSSGRSTYATVVECKFPASSMRSSFNVHFIENPSGRNSLNNIHLLLIDPQLLSGLSQDGSRHLDPASTRLLSLDPSFIRSAALPIVGRTGLMTPLAAGRSPASSWPPKVDHTKAPSGNLPLHEPKQKAGCFTGDLAVRANERNAKLRSQSVDRLQTSPGRTERVPLRRENVH